MTKLLVVILAAVILYLSCCYTSSESLGQVLRADRDREDRERAYAQAGNASEDSTLREVRDRAKREHADGMGFHRHTAETSNASNAVNATELKRHYA